MYEAAQLGKENEMIKVGFPVPLDFSVRDFCNEVQARGYKNHKYDYDFDRLLDHLPEINRKYKNCILAKAVLSHCFGEMLALDFRNWVRERMDPSIELEDGGSSIAESEEVSFD